MSPTVEAIPPPASNHPNADAWFITGGGEMGALIRAIDWRTTLLGPSSEWPQSLRTALSICLYSRFPIALYWGPQYVMLYNQSLVPMVGSNKHPLAMGRPAFEVLPEIRSIIEPLLDQVRRTGEATGSEDLMLPLVRGAGAEESYFTFTYSPIHDETGGVGGVFCAVIETTEKVIEERRLRLLHALADATQARTKEDACAQAAAQIARFPSDVPFALVYLVDEGAKVARLAGASNIEPGSARAPRSIAFGDRSLWPFEEGATEHAPVLVDLADGPGRPRAAVILPIERSGGGRPLGFLVAGLSPMLRKSVSYDRLHHLLASSLSQVVSSAAAYEEERKRAESLWLATARAAREAAEVEARQRANLYRHFMQAPFPVAVFKGPRHLVELANPAVLQSWGKGPEVLGKPLAEAIPELRGQPFLGYLDEVYRTGVPFEAREHAAKLPTGPHGELQEGYFNFVYAPLRDTGGVTEGILLSAFDVTTQVLARHDVARSIELLKEATEERTQALEELRRASLAKDEFLATMSHELRTPLNAIVGWSSLLRNGAVAGPQIQKALETIERNARMQARLIEDMLDLARIERGKLVLSVGPTELVRVVEAALDAVRPAAELKGVRLQQVLDSHATIVGDADRLQQVVWNLLSNAIKFTPKGRRVQVRLHRERSHVELVVADDGQGIDPAFLPHVFDRFRQADARTSRTVGGLGLGLAIVRSIVQLHGGTVVAESDGEGLGSTFTVRLPTAPLRADSSRPTRTGDPEPDPVAVFECPAELAGLRVLVADDEHETRELLKYLLERCDAVVTVAAGAEEALAALGNATFDVLISDVGMPGIDGHALMRSVRALPLDGGSRIPAIALTAYARGEDRTAALRAGFDMHLAKPIEPAELLVVIATLVQGVKRRLG